MEIKISEELNGIIKYARDEAMRTGSRIIDPDHLFLGIIRHGENYAYTTLKSLGADMAQMKEFIDSHIFKNEQIPYSEMDYITFGRASQNVLSITVLEAKKADSSEASSPHLLLALSRNTENYGKVFLRNSGIDYPRILAYMQDQGMLAPTKQESSFQNEEPEMESESVGQDAKPAINLEEFGYDLTKAAAEGKLDPVVGRDSEISRVIEVLGRRKKNNPMLI